MDNKIKFVEFPVIETDRLKLRLITKKDSRDLFSILSSEEVMEYYGAYPMRDISQAEVLIEKFKTSFEMSNGVRWGIEIKGTNKIIGTCGFHNWNKKHYRAEIGYELNDGFWRQGYGEEAVLAAIKYGFNEMNLVRIEAVVYPENIASENMLKKMCFAYEGLLRKYAFFRDKYQDLNMFSIVK
ncbi:GNAT family protein [Clostridium sp. HBUAS56017]|uniref:GNAT family N-acetyltransferase n=1 Tax=Clostridium sp. HBUAS56017 TaxID=2571128 RepID=UPI0011777798|nr:GNAT family protein [Clostridium sp. HBUAS56017]